MEKNKYGKNSNPECWRDYKLKREQKDPNSYPRIQEYRVKKTEIQRIIYIIYFIYFWF